MPEMRQANSYVWTLGLDKHHNVREGYSLNYDVIFLILSTLLYISPFIISITERGGFTSFYKKALTSLCSRLAKYRLAAQNIKKGLR